MITHRDASMAAFLQSVPVFQDLEGPSLEVLYEFLEERRWDVGEVICTEGDPGVSMYIIREGEVEVLRKAESSNEVGIVRLGPGECFGEMTLVEQQPRSASIVVRKRALTYSLTNVDLYNLVNRYNFAHIIILHNICRLLSRRLRKADSRIVEFLDQQAAARPPARTVRRAKPAPAAKAKRATTGKRKVAAKVRRR